MADLTQYLPGRLTKPDQVFNQALIKAVNQGSDKILQLIQACIDQFFLTTATGKYLVQLGEEQGFVMPANSGLDIRAYRVLVPLMVSSPKQVRKTFEETIEAFYGSDRTRPSIMAATYEPYALRDGDDLSVQSETGTINISFIASRVSNIAAVSASELAAVLNSTQSGVFADSVADRLTGNKYLRLTCTTAGTMAFIRVVGGTAQNVLKFPHVIPTAQIAGNVWSVSKISSYSDIMTIKWASGQNPKLYLVQKGDVVTIRGLDDYLTGPYGSGVTIKGNEDNAATIISSHPINNINDLYVAIDTGHGWLWNGAAFIDVGGLTSLIEGSYQIVDSGYDYIIVRNTSFPGLSYNFTQPADDTFCFTSQVKVNIYDNAEYGLASETENNTATITIPAIPPLARRFLSGSAHLHGSQLDIQSFSRSGVTITLPEGTDKPIGTNQFVLSNVRSMYDFRKPFYKTTSVDSSIMSPSYSVLSNDPAYSALPFTSPVVIGSNPIYCEVNTNQLVLTFNYPHGLQEGWEITLSDIDPIGNFSTDVLNTNLIVNTITSPFITVCTIIQNTGINIGLPLNFSGVSFGTFNIYRYGALLSDGSDFYLEFPTEADVIASGLELNQIFVIQSDSGTDVDKFYANFIKHRKLQVKSIAGNIVNVVTGLGSGSSTTLVSSGAYGNRSANFGGSAPKYFFDQTSSWNVANVMNNLKACFLAYTPSSNAAYVGSYIYDPQGLQTMYTVSKYITYTTGSILRGSNPGVIFITKASNLDGGLTFPQSGTMMLDYGTDGVEGPISYLAVIDGGPSAPSQIVIDPAYRFQTTHDAGAQVQYIHSKTPYVPGIDGSDYPVYVTGTAQARNTLFTLLEGLVAGGVFLQKDVLLPNLRYQDSAIEPFE